MTTVLSDTKTATVERNSSLDGVYINGIQPVQQLHKECAPNLQESMPTDHGTADNRPPSARQTWPLAPRVSTNAARAPPFQRSDYIETPHTPHFWQYTKPRESTSRRFPRISRPVELLRNTYDVVVIGSGYGGGVAASRMARGRQRVCVLERGKERWPGEYPTKMEDALKQLHVTGVAKPWNAPVGKLVQNGDPTGLYHLMLGEGQNVFVGNGLGGTSLLNANVFLEADDGAMSLENWPEELQKAGALDKYYKRAADMLEPKKYPSNAPPLPKLSMLEKQAKLLGFQEDFRRVQQTTRFEDGPNWAGVQMSASTGSGQDCTGVNDGSKSSTLVNYLSDAWNWGAEIFCECEVRHIRKHPKEGYLIFFAWHGAGRGAFAGNIYDDLMWVHAKKFVFLGAGTLGTTEILLRSQQLGLETSAKVGKGMSGNGDMLSFGYNMKEEVHAIGKESSDAAHPPGPTITGIIDRRKTGDPLDGYVIEEGAIPEALAPYFRAMLLATPGKIYGDYAGYPRYVQKITHLVATRATRLFRPFAHIGAIERTQVYLIMSHDDNQATLKLKNDKPELLFRGVGRSDKVRELDNILAKATTKMGGTYINNPFYAAFGQQEISVHPIGGANMSNNGTGQTGVANHVGQVFKSKGSEVHDGLVVVDGSIIPTALGVNPFATITALAERSVEHIAEANQIKIDYNTKNDILNILSTPPAHPMKQYESVEKAENMITKAIEANCEGFGFTEVMSGYIHMGDSIKDFDLACSTARGLCEGARFFLSVNSWNLVEMVASGDHEAMLTGSFACALPGSPFMINRGSFQLLNSYLKSSDTKNMTYDFDMTGVNGEKVHFHGYKVINNSVALNPWAYWKATTTLNVVLSTPHTTDCKLLGRGILRIQPSDFKSELFSMHSYGPGALGKLASASSFLNYFTKQSAGLFLTPFSFLQYPSQTRRDFNGLNIEDHFHVYASDKVKSEMKMWNPSHFKPGHSARPPVILMIPGASVDHEIYALPTIEHNAVDHLRHAGYRIYTVTHRIGKNDENRSARGPTNYEARLDIEAAIRKIREREGPEKIYVIAHCMGSVAFGMGLMDGTIPAAWIKGITASQVFINPIWYIENMVKTWFPIGLDSVYRKAVGLWYSCNSSRNDSWLQQSLNQALRFYPVGRREELCNSVCCHRCSFVFGRLWNHKNLNEATHSQVDRFFSGVNMTWLHHAMKFGVLGNVTNDLDHDIATDDNIRRIKGIPILLFSGSDNVVLDPESTMRSYDRLRKVNGPQGYRREVIEGYGHIDGWMGKSAYEHVYPMVLEHVDQVYGRAG